MVRIGIAGIGFMGTTHFVAAKSLEGGRVTAIATRDRQKWTGDWSGIRGNFGAGGGKQDLSGIAKYETLTEMIQDPDVDLVDLCLPTDLHRETVIQSLEAGKHVLVEKPIALDLADAEAMNEVALATGKKLFVAQVLRFFPEYKLLKEMIDEGEYGAPVGIHFKRMISGNWKADTWFSSIEHSGGPVYDLLIHDADFVQFLFGLPNRVMATAFTREGRVVYYDTQLIYDNINVSVTITGGVAGMGVRSFEQGFDAYMEDGFIQYNSTLRNPPLLLTRGGETTELKTGDTDPFLGQLQYVVDTLRGKETGDVLSGVSATRSLKLCLAVEQSIQSGQVVEL